MKFNWGHGLIVALACFIVFILTLMFTAGGAGDVINEDYYEQDLSYQKVIDAKKNYNALKEKPTIVNQANGILFQFPKDINPKITGSIYLERGNSEGLDVKQKLQLDKKNEQLISIVKLHEGDYSLVLTWIDNGKSYRLERDIKWKSPS